MPSISPDAKILFWVIAAVAGTLFAILGNELSINIVRIFSRRGRPPKKRPFYLWISFYTSLSATIVLGALAAFGPPVTAETKDHEYVGSVVSVSREPVQGAKVTLDSGNISQTDFTDSQGMYRFRIPAASTPSSRIRVTAEGFQFYSENIFLDPDSGVIKEIRLIPMADVTPTTGPTYEATGTVTTPQAIIHRNSATISCEVEQVNLRSSPGYLDKDESTDVIIIIDCGQKVEILGGNQNSDGLTWWKVSWNDYTGWIADHTGDGKVILIFNE